MLAMKIFTYGGLAMFAGLVVGYLVAAWKNLDASRWGFISFFFPPAIFFLLLRGRRNGPPVKRRGWDEQDAIDHNRHHPPN